MHRRRALAPGPIAWTVALAAGLLAGSARAEPTTKKCAKGIAGDVVDQVTVLGDTRVLRFYMDSGCVHDYPIIEGVVLPAEGSYWGSKHKNDIRIERHRPAPGKRNHWSLKWRGKRPKGAPRVASLPARKRFAVVVRRGLTSGTSSETSRVKKARQPDKETAASRRKTPLQLDMASPKHVAAWQARGLVDDRDRDRGDLLAKLGRGERLSFQESVALWDGMQRALAHELGQPVDQAAKDHWQSWARFTDKNRDKLAGKPGPGKDRLTRHQMKALLAKHKKWIPLQDPMPTVSGRQRKREVKYDPAVREAWNRLSQWERDLWKEYWAKYPAAPQAAGRTDLTITQSDRFRMALRMSVEYMPQGMRQAAREMLSSSAFLWGVATSITLYVVAWVIPEPLSKVFAATVTGVLLSLFAYSEIENLVVAWYDLRQAANRARTMADLTRAAQAFGASIGGTGLRIITVLFAYFAGKHIMVPRIGKPVRPGPNAPAVASGGAAAAAMPRVAVAGNVQFVVLANGEVVMVPIAHGIYQSSMESGQASGASNTTQSSGANASGSQTGPGSGAKQPGAQKGGKEGKETFKLAKHRDHPSPRPTGTQSHHGVMSAWMKKHFPKYKAKYAPAILMPKEAHQRSFAVYNRWRASIKKEMGGRFDWGKVTERQMRELSEKMFDAAGVPANVRAEYWKWFERMKLALQQAN